MLLLNTYYRLYVGLQKIGFRYATSLTPFLITLTCFALLPQPCTREEELHRLDSRMFTGSHL